MAMKIQIGTRVKFLNDVGGGIVRGFKDDRLAVVETDDGFEMPVVITDLIPDVQSAYGVDDDSSSSPAAEPAETKQKVTVSFEEQKFVSFKGEAILALVPQNDQLLHVSDFDLFLVNDSNYYFTYSLTYRDASVSTHIKTGTLEPDTKEVLDIYSQTMLGKILEFRIQGFFHKHGLTEVAPPVDTGYSLEGISFYKKQYFSENEYFDQVALIFRKEPEIGLREAIDKLKSGDIAKVASIKEQREKKEEKKSPKNSQIEEIDLHIHELVEDYSTMSNSEMLKIQLEHFETALDRAIQNRVARIVFIHGVGNGVLKLELRKKLDRKYSNLRYQDASFKEYGYGATLVYLQ